MMESMTTEKLNKLLRQIAPETYNHIIIDGTLEPKEYNYCYIYAFGQHVEYHTTIRSAYVESALAQRLKLILSSTTEGPYLPLHDRSLIEDLNQAPTYGKDTLLNSAKLRISELINGGRAVGHGDLHLELKNGRIALTQPLFIILAESAIFTDPENEGKQVATFAYFEPIVSEKSTELVRCSGREIEGLSHEVIKQHKGDEPIPKRMLTHLNGIDKEQYDEALIPYLDLIHDRIGDENMLEEIYFRIIPCYTFNYRTIVSDKSMTGTLIDPYLHPEVIFETTSLGNTILDGISDSVKSILRLFGNLAKTDKFKETEDLLRASRLLIAVAVADGIVAEEEKRSLTQAIQNLEQLKERERTNLVALLYEKDGNFLNENDFHFNSQENVQATLIKMEELALADGYVHEMENFIIEKLKQYNQSWVR